MVLKKVNAIIALIVSLVMMIHNTMNMQMVRLGRVEDSPKMIARALIFFFIIHAFVSIFIIIFKNDGKETKYTNISSGWLVQRITGIALLPIVIIHGFLNVGDFGLQVIHIIIIQVVIMLLSYIHIPIAVPNALVTLGFIDNIKTHKVVRLALWVVCVALFIINLIPCVMVVIAL